MGLFATVTVAIAFLDAFFFREWKWTDGNSATRLKLVGKIKNFHAIQNQHNRSFCCMLTEDDKLECTNCTEEHGYICEGYPG